jgi:hypothetical protein
VNPVNKLLTLVAFLLPLTTAFAQSSKKQEMTAKLFAEGVTLSESSLARAKTGKVRVIVMKNDKGTYQLLCHVLVLNGEENPGCVVPRLGIKYDLYTTTDGPYPENNVGLVEADEKKPKPNGKAVGLYYLGTVTAK